MKFPFIWCIRSDKYHNRNMKNKHCVELFMQKKCASTRFELRRVHYSYLFLPQFHDLFYSLRITLFSDRIYLIILNSFRYSIFFTIYLFKILFFFILTPRPWNNLFYSVVFTDIANIRLYRGGYRQLIHPPLHH